MNNRDYELNNNNDLVGVLVFGRLDYNFLSPDNYLGVDHKNTM